METSFDKILYSFKDSSKLGIKANQLIENIKKNSYDFSKENKNYISNHSKSGICRIKIQEKKEEQMMNIFCKERKKSDTVISKN